MYNSESSTKSTSSQTLEYTEPPQAPIISIIDRNIIRQKLGAVRQEIDATIRMIERTERDIRTETIQTLLIRWHQLLDSSFTLREDNAQETELHAVPEEVRQS